MSIVKVYAVRDRAVDAFANPMFAPSEGGMVRAFRDEVLREGSEMNKHPEDYDLYELGEFDQESGLFKCDRPKQVAIGKSFIAG